MRYNITAQTAAVWISLYYFGITIGRFVSGFITKKLNNVQMIRLGQVVLFSGIVLILIPISVYRLPFAFCMIGLGCAPIYPSMLHQTPKTFGKENSQAMMGIQMASAYVGSTLMPPFFGAVAQYLNISLFPVFLLILLVIMFTCTEFVKKRLPLELP